MATFVYPPVTISTSGLATEATLQSVDSHVANIETSADNIDTTTQSIDTNTSSTAASASSIDTKTPALGQALMAASSPVVIASDQSAVPVSGPLTDTQLRASAVPVSGPLTDTQLRASAVPVSGPLTDTQLRASAVPVSAAALPLPAGAATSANQATEIASLSSIDGKLASLGQKAMAGSEPVVIASDQSAIPVSQSGTWNLTNISGTVSLPTGAATSANQTTSNTSLANIDSNTSLDVVDQLDTPLLDTSSSNITASSGNPLQVVSSTAAAVKKIISVEDIGAYIGLYTGAALSEVLKCVLPLGGGEVELKIPAGTRISLRAMENTAISSGKIAINFQG